MLSFIIASLIEVCFTNVFSAFSSLKSKLETVKISGRDSKEAKRQLSPNVLRLAQPFPPVNGSLISVPDGLLDLEDSFLGEVSSLTPKIIILGSSVEDTG